MRLHIVLATTDTHIAAPLIDSMFEYLPNWNLSFHVLLIGQKYYSPPLPHHPIQIFHSTSDNLSIHTSRNLCQNHLRQTLMERGGVGLVLDDDLQWFLSEERFNQMVHELVENRCDMAFSALAGDPPIPKEYTRASALLDVLVNYSRNCATPVYPELDQFLEQFTFLENSTDIAEWEHHDFYAFKKDGFLPVHLETEHWNWLKFIEALWIGKKTTRPVKLPDRILPATGRERGGATLIFNPLVLQIKNTALHWNGWVSRRSDMLMAIAAYKQGYCLHQTPAMLMHNRVFTFDTQGTKKSVGDILGYALVENYSREKPDFQVFANMVSHRIQRTHEILMETNRMFSILPHITNLSENCVTLIHQMVEENHTLIEQIRNIDIEAIRPAYEQWLQTVFLSATHSLTTPTTSNCLQATDTHPFNTPFLIS